MFFLVWLSTNESVRPVESTLSDDEGDEEEEEESEQRKIFAFPELDQRIREIISEYGAVFPKLSFSSPRVSTPTFDRPCASPN